MTDQCFKCGRGAQVLAAIVAVACWAGTATAADPFDTEMVALNLTGGPYPMPLASDPTNALGDSIDGYGFVDSLVTIQLSSQRTTNPGPPSTGQVQARELATGAPLVLPIAPDQLDGRTFAVDSFFDVSVDLTFMDVDARPGRDFAGQPDGASLVLPDVHAALASHGTGVFDKNAPLFGLFPRPEDDPLLGFFLVEIPLGGDINGNGTNDKMKFTIAAFSALDANRTFTSTAAGHTLSQFNVAALIEGAVVDETADPPFMIGTSLPSGLPDPSSFSGSATTDTQLPEPASLGLLAVAGAAVALPRHRRRPAAGRTRDGSQI